MLSNILILFKFFLFNDQYLGMHTIQYSNSHLSEVNHM